MSDLVYFVAVEVGAGSGSRRRDLLFEKRTAALVVVVVRNVELAGGVGEESLPWQLPIKPRLRIIQFLEVALLVI